MRKILFLILLIIAFSLISVISLKGLEESSNETDEPFELVSAYFSFSSIVLPTPKPSVSCGACNTGTCVCAVSNCDKGVVDFFSSESCLGVPYNEKVFSSGSFEFAISKKVYIAILCDNGNVSNCTTVEYWQTNPTTSTTTTTLAKAACPYDCCSNEGKYFDKNCYYGSVCTDHVCRIIVTTTTSTSVSETETTTTTETKHKPFSFKINFSLFAAIFLSIAIFLFLLWYVFGFVIGRNPKRIDERIMKKSV